MKATAAALAFLALAPVAARAETAPDRTADEAALTTIKTDIWPGYYRNQDAEGLAAFLDPAFVNIGPDGAVSTRADELEGVKAEPWNPSNFRYEVGNFVWLRDDLVIVVGQGSSDRRNEEGQPCRHSYTSSNLLERAADAPNGWRALSSHVSGVKCEKA
ncbi:nuclear transport factor 2 family protein [Hyphococcus sp.]|uniref:nuclear transport factor 2 family protein n=1 Tax=Hyphococcus sp. TaxID=2038636 RepID=UPI003D0DFEFD